MLAYGVMRIQLKEAIRLGEKIRPTIEFQSRRVMVLIGRSSFALCLEKMRACRTLAIIAAWAICAGLAGCSAHTGAAPIAKAPANAPLQTASKSDLIAKYDELAQSITAINAKVAINFTAGSEYSGAIKRYHQINGFILAQKPAFVRVIGQLPVVGTNIFNMVSDGTTFSIYVPSKNQFLTGPATLERPSEKATENLRPQHLMEAIFWEPISDADPVLFEQTMDNGAGNYVLTVVAGSAGSRADWRISRKIWFERAGLTMSRIETYDDSGRLLSDIHYSGWAPFGSIEYPKQIKIERPADDYTLAFSVTTLTPNETVPASSFVLQQPPTAQVVHVGEASRGGQTP